MSLSLAAFGGSHFLAWRLLFSFGCRLLALRTLLLTLPRLHLQFFGILAIFLFEADICAAVLNFLPICSRVYLLQTAADVNRPARASLYHIAVTTPTLSSAAGSRPF